MKPSSYAGLKRNIRESHRAIFRKNDCEQDYTGNNRRFFLSIKPKEMQGRKEL